MSDPTARRGDVITATLEWMRQNQKKKGLSKREIKSFMFKRYRYGVREQTLDLIFQQLIDHKKIYGEPIGSGRASNVFRYFANPEKTEE